MSHVGLLTGGSTPERGVALSGAGQVVAALRSLGHEVVVADTCGGTLDRWQEADRLRSDVGSAPVSTREMKRLQAIEDVHGAIEQLLGTGVDVVLPVLHGGAGEGGLVQAALELAGAVFCGSDARASFLAMDKLVSKQLFRQCGIPTADWWVWPASGEEIEALGLPLIVKPSRVGSTVGLSVVDRVEDLDEAIGRALQYDDEVLLERFLPGRELTVGVLGGRALGVGEIVAPGQVFDFESKYTPGAAQEIFPAQIPDELTAELQELALRSHRALRLRHYSRVDFRLDAEGRPVCLEANTLPGMTRTSLLPQSAAVVGIDFAQLCGQLVELGLQAERDR